MTVRQSLARFARTPRRLASNTSGVALLEFAFGMPLVLMLGLYGIEVANQALVNLRISQIALNLADNASRVGIIDSSNVEQLREVDMNDVLQAARMQGSSIKLTTYGRVTVSSLENVGGVQRIHWQRCIGLKSGSGFDSSYGITSGNGTTPGTSIGSPYDPTAGVNTASSGDNSGSHPGSLAVGGSNGVTLSGMGDSAANAVQAPLNGGVMFVEINYQYQPIVGTWLTTLIGSGSLKVHYIASFVVRDNRTFSQIYNPVTSPVTPRATCDKYAV